MEAAASSKVAVQRSLIRRISNSFRCCRIPGSARNLSPRPAADKPATEHRYQPGRPLNRINLYEFKTLDETIGDDSIGQSLEHIDPILAHYDAALATTSEQEFFQKNLEQLFADHPFDESRPPFALGERSTAK